MADDLRREVERLREQWQQRANTAQYFGSLLHPEYPGHETRESETRRSVWSEAVQTLDALLARVPSVPTESAFVAQVLSQLRTDVEQKRAEWRRGQHGYDPAETALAKAAALDWVLDKLTPREP